MDPFLDSLLKPVWLAQLAFGLWNDGFAAARAIPAKRRAASSARKT